MNGDNDPTETLVVNHCSLILPISRRSTSITPSRDGYVLSKTSSISSMRSGVSRSGSPISTYSNRSSNSTRSFSKKSLTTSRRTFPQNYSDETAMNLCQLKSMDPASVVFDGKISFVLGCKKQRVRQELHSQPAHNNPKMASNYLSNKIENFLKRTDHIMDEWKAVGGKNDDATNNNMTLIEKQRQIQLGRSKSLANILIKGFQMRKSMPPTETNRSRNSSVSLNHRHDGDDVDDDASTIADEVNVKCIY